MAHIEALGLLAAAGRALPFVGWASGRATATPGVNIPGMRHRNPLIFDTARGHRGGDAERLLESVVKRIGDQLDEQRADGGAFGGRGGPGPDDVDMHCEGTAANRDGGGDAGRRAAPGGVDDGSRCQSDGAGHEGLPNGCAGADASHGYAADDGASGPQGPPYSGTPTGDARSAELRAGLQRTPEPPATPEPPPGRKRGGSPEGGQEEVPRPVRRCLDREPGWGAPGGHETGGTGGGRVHLLSLFDGVGTAMVAMVELFAAMGCPGKFAGGWFAEKEDHLAVPVAKYWADRRGNGTPRFERVAGDVWDLLRNRGAALARVLREVEPGAMLLIVGGSPCQQLTLAGRHGGREGLCGGDSWNFYVFPLILYAAKHARPDIDVHVSVENAGSMMDKFKKAIAGALGIPVLDAHPGAPREAGAGDNPGDFAPIVDARQFSPYTRKRIFFSTLPPARDLWAIRGGRPPPWDAGWERRSTSGLGPLKDMPPMMRGRGPCPGTRPSAYQFHPDFLLYSGNMLNVAHFRIIPAITQAMPENVREGFRGIMASRRATGDAARDPERERKTDAAAQWMHDNGTPLGFRAPRAAERARAFGMGRYLADLGLSEKELFDATGNMFDKDALLVRIGCPVKKWVNGEPVPARDAPSPTQTGAGYEALRESSAGAGVGTRPAPVPSDMPNLLKEMEGWDLRGEAEYRGTAGAIARPAPPSGSARGSQRRDRGVTTRPGPRTRAGSSGGGGSDDGYDLAGALGIGGVRPPRRGAAGGPARLGVGNYCVMDSFAQVLDGAPRACVDPGAERRAEGATGEVRRLCGIEGAGIVPTAAAWIWAVAERYAPGAARPILVELGTAGRGGDGARGHSSQVVVFASDGPWDGTVCAVASDGSHTVPLLWCGTDGSMAPNSTYGEELPSRGLCMGDPGGQRPRQVLS